MRALSVNDCAPAPAHIRAGLGLFAKFTRGQRLRPQDSNLDLTAPKAVVLPLH